MSKLKYGIIGVGNISPKHLDGYSVLKDDVEIVACCDLVQEKMDDKSRRYNIPRQYQDLHQLIADKDIDFVSVCLPNHLHNPVTIEALKAGKHVHCEKPMAMTGDLAQEMLDVSRQTGKKLMVGLQNRFLPESQFLKRYIDEGGMGDIYFAKCGWTQRKITPHNIDHYTDLGICGGGPLIDTGPHAIDLALHFAGYPNPVSVKARTYQKFLNDLVRNPLYVCPGYGIPPEVKYPIEDLAVAFAEFDNGLSMMIEHGFVTNTAEERFFYELYGTKGGVKFEQKNSGDVFKVFTSAAGLLVDVEPKIYAPHTPYLMNEFKHFVHCIRTGAHPDRIPPEEGVTIMRLIDGIYASARTGELVKF